MLTSQLLLHMSLSWVWGSDLTPPPGLPQRQRTQALAVLLFFPRSTSGQISLCFPFQVAQVIKSLNNCLLLCLRQQNLINHFQIVCLFVGRPIPSLLLCKINLSLTLVQELSEPPLLPPGMLLFGPCTIGLLLCVRVELHFRHPLQCIIATCLHYQTTLEKIQFPDHI